MDELRSVQSVCGACKKESEKLSTCSGCLNQFYCSPSCQKSDWKVHKKICKSYKIQEVKGKGMGMVAARDIKQGDLIIQEEAVLIINKSDANSRQNLTKQFQNLKKSKQTEVLSLHDPEAEGCAEDKLVRIFKNNGIDVNGSSTAVLYTNIPRINHGCAANVIWSQKIDNPLAKEVRALRNISRGEEILANYIDSWEASFLSHTQRQERLRKWKFDCNCSVCSLPEDKIIQNNQIRKEISVQHKLVEKLMSRWDIKKAVAAAERKLNLSLQIKDEIVSSLPASYLELYEMYRIKQVMCADIDNKSTDHCLQAATKLSTMFGPSFRIANDNKVAEIEKTVQQIAKNRNKLNIL